MNMRFHVVSLPHTNVTSQFAACAFTQKVLRFCQMMKAKGHHVTLYAGTESDAPCDELVACLNEEQRQRIVGSRHYTEADWQHPLAQLFNLNAAKALAQRAEPHDFICLIGGRAQQSIAEVFPNHLSIEFGIGYAGTFAPFRVFESYAWMHTVYGAQTMGDAAKADGQWFDAVIPNQVDPYLFPAGEGGGGYYLYVGRLIDRKGYRIAQDVCEKLGKRLILAGPGERIGYGEFVGEIGPVERARLMGGAAALFAPTVYVEPFGTVTIEAMACGTPVICTDWGAFTETVEQGVGGYRCRTLGEFVEAAEAAKGLDRKAIRKRALARFSMDVVGEQYERYFKRLSTLWGKGWYA